VFGARARTGTTRSYGEGSQDAILFKYSLSLDAPQITLEFNVGWNMVSLPIIPDDPLASSVLGDVGFYQLVTWSGTGYVPVTTFEAGQGYWLLVIEDVNVTITGTPVESLNLTLSPGWSTIGGLFSDVQAPGVFPGPYHLVTWNGAGYMSPQRYSSRGKATGH
jgi:hypothetical protein